MTMKLLVMTAIGSLAATAAAAEPWQQHQEAELGASVTANIASQTIDMDPHYAGVPAPGSNGRRSADALVRYETGKLKPLIKTNGKTDLGGQGGAQDTPSAAIQLLGTGSPN